MKVYNLCCEHDHRFEGWFASEEDFISQLAGHLLECPVCESRGIKRLPSAPRLNLSAPQTSESKDNPATQFQQFQQYWFETARKIIKDTEDVGERFAEEARRIYYNEAPDRGIRGVASPDEREALAEEGIEVLTLPIPASLKQPLQ